MSWTSFLSYSYHLAYLLALPLLGLAIAPCGYAQIDAEARYGWALRADLNPQGGDTSRPYDAYNNPMQRFDGALRYMPPLSFPYVSLGLGIYAGKGFYELDHTTVVIDKMILEDFIGWDFGPDLLVSAQHPDYPVALRARFSYGRSLYNLRAQITDRRLDGDLHRRNVKALKGQAVDTDIAYDGFVGTMSFGVNVFVIPAFAFTVDYLVSRQSLRLTISELTEIVLDGKKGRSESRTFEIEPGVLIPEGPKYIFFGHGVLLGALLRL